MIESYKIKIDTPFNKKGDIVNDTLGIIGCPSYPELYEPIYTLEDGTEVCIGDLVWRSKNYEVKSTKFNKAHMVQNTPVFGSRESCEKWLADNAKNIKAELLKQNRDSSFQTLKSWVNKLDSLETLSYQDLSKIREGLRACINNIENL